MRIDEITINIPIKIDLDNGKPQVKVAGKRSKVDKKIDLDNGKPQVKVAGKSPKVSKKMDQNPVMVPPLQQDIELKKSNLGKSSPVIDKMLDPSDQGSEVKSDQENNLKNLKTLAGLSR